MPVDSESLLLSTKVSAWQATVISRINLVNELLGTPDAIAFIRSVL